MTLSFCHPSRSSGLVTCLQLAMLFSCLLLAMLFSPAVGPLFCTSCRSALWVSFHQDHPSVRVHPVCWRTRSPGVAVCECVNLAPRAPYTHHLRSVVPWFVKGLRWFDELCARPRADPRVRCAWSGVTQNHSLPSPSHGCVCRGRCLQSSVLRGMVVNSAVPRVLPLSCVAGNTSSLSLCLEGLHTAPFVGLCSARSPAIVHCGPH